MQYVGIHCPAIGEAGSSGTFQWYNKLFRLENADEGGVHIDHECGCNWFVHIYI